MLDLGVVFLGGVLLSDYLSVMKILLVVGLPRHPVLKGRFQGLGFKLALVRHGF